MFRMINFSYHLYNLHYCLIYVNADLIQMIINIFFSKYLKYFHLIYIVLNISYTLHNISEKLNFFPILNKAKYV